MERQPNLDGPAAGQAAFLRRELAKQKRHAPLRKLFHESGTVILELTPCLLMSPLSVATFLPKDTVQFDVVIFDEASQVPSEEATGAILRGRQLIVAGDAKQLPPTRFFERSLDDGDDSDEQEQAPLDSLLEDCDASGMQSCKLLWHYRSKHEGLIAFSNAEFYNNDLVTFPAPKAKTHPGVGVRLVHVEDGVYDRGRSRTNRREAKRVAQLIEQHCREWGLKRSIGVIALSTAQEAAISEEIENLLERRPDLEPLLRPDSGEAFFVKPLENVQGDERDTIIISIGYGKSQDGQLSLNFGPINSPGGEKRLNVAVTRARWELVLVSSILASDIDESRLQSTGPKVLRRYLAFAKDGRLPAETVAPSGESESPFEAAVWEALNERGITADRQVGMSGYRIDLAIKDPDNLGEYLLGVECDGAAYHSSAVARDRDRLRQQILEDLGWRVHRIWSTDWIRDPKGCMLRLLQRLDEVKSSREGPTVAPDVPDAPSRGAAQESERQSDEPATPPDMRPEQDFEEGSYEGQPGIGVYDETPVAYRSREQFDLDHLIQTDLVDVVRREGPIHEELLARRVARIYQLKRTGHLVEGRIRRIISASCMRGEIRRKGSFVWMKDAVTVVPRRPAPGAELRQIEHVSPEELEAAALLVVRRSVGIAKDHLIQEAPRVLGYLRSGEKIRPAVLDAVNRLLEAGTLVVRGEHLFDGG